MMKSLMIISMVVFPTVASAANSFAQPYHSLSGGPPSSTPAYSWSNPGWSEGATSGYNTGYGIARSMAGSASAPGPTLPGRMFEEEVIE
jgi:hypothetical protein